MFTGKKKFFALSIALVFVSCLLLTGCGRDQNQSGTSSDNNQTPSTQNSSDLNSGMNGTNTQDNMNGATNRMGTNTATTDNTALHDRAEKIADAVIKDVEQVSDARVIISEKMAYVSVEITKTADAQASETLKEEIGRVVKKTDTQIEDVYVMEDADTFTRMKEMVEDIGNGHPISGFVDELDTMFTRVMPSRE